MPPRTSSCAIERCFGIADFAAQPELPLLYAAVIWIRKTPPERGLAARQATGSCRWRAPTQGRSAAQQSGCRTSVRKPKSITVIPATLHGFRNRETLALKFVFQSQEAVGVERRLIHVQINVDYKIEDLFRTIRLSVRNMNVSICLTIILGCDLVNVCPANQFIANRCKWPFGDARQCQNKASYHRYPLTLTNSIAPTAAAETTNNSKNTGRARSQTPQGGVTVRVRRNCGAPFSRIFVTASIRGEGVGHFEISRNHGSIWRASVSAASWVSYRPDRCVNAVQGPVDSSPACLVHSVNWYIPVGKRATSSSL